MKTVQKANKQMKVSDDRLKDFLERGYAEVDVATGKLIQEPEVDNRAECASLKAAHGELVEKYAEAEKLCAERAVEIEALREQLAEAQKPKK